MSVNKIPQIKALNQIVIAKGKTLYGIGNQYSLNGESVVVGFTTTKAYVIKYEGEYVGAELFKEAIKSWLIDDELTLDEITSFDEAIIVAEVADDCTAIGTVKGKELFDVKTINNITAKLEKINALISGEIELSMEETMKLMSE